MVSRLSAAIILVSLLALVGLEGGAMNTPDAAAGGSWTANIRVNDVPHTATSLSMAVDGPGNVYVLWMAVTDPAAGNVGGIYFSLRSATTGGWSTPVKVSDAPGQYAGVPTAIAVDGSGNAYAVWLDRRGSSSGDNIFFSRRDASTGVWSPNERLNSVPGRVQADSFGGPAFAVDPSGNAFVLWEDDREGVRYPGGPVALYAARRDGGSGQWAPDQRFSQEGEAWGSEPILRADSAGNFYVIWLSATGYEAGSRTFVNPSRKLSRWGSDLGAWSTGAPISSDLNFGVGRIAVDPQGNLHNVTDSTFNIRDAATGAWGAFASFRDPGAAGQASGVSIALDSEGNDWVAWMDTRNRVLEGSPSVVIIVHGPEIWAARRSGVAGVFGPNLRVDDHTVGSDRLPPKVGVDRRGNVYAAWLDFRDNPNGRAMPGTGAGDIYFSMAPGIQAVLPLVAKGSVAGW